MALADADRLASVRSFSVGFSDLFLPRTLVLWPERFSCNQGSFTSCQRLATSDLETKGATRQLAW